MITEKQIDYILYLKNVSFFKEEEERFYLSKMTCEEASEYINELLENEKKKKELKAKKEEALNDKIFFENDEEKIETIKLIKNNDLEDLIELLNTNINLAKKLYNINIFKSELDKKINDIFYNMYNRDLEEFINNFIY